MLKFDTAWNDEIASMTDTSEYQTATVELWDTSIKPEYNIDTGASTYPAGVNPVLYSGQARIIFPRWGVFSGGEGQANAKTNTTARVQIPQHAMGRVKRGFRFKVLVSPRNESLEGRWLTVTSDTQGSSAASRTFECSFDMDQAPASTDPFVPTPIPPETP